MAKKGEMGQRSKNAGLLALGTTIGFCSAALGIGGGVVAVPALLFFGYEIKKATAISLATIFPAAFVGAAAHYFIAKGNVKFVIAALIIVGAVRGAKWGVALSHRLSDKLQKRLFAFVMLAAGLRMILGINLPTIQVNRIAAYPLLIVLGLFSGMISAVFGVGSGTVLVPALYLFFGLSIHEAVATSLVAITATAFAGAMFYKKSGNMDRGAVKLLVPMAMAGAVAGAVAANALPAESIKIAFGILMIAGAFRVFFERKR